MNYKSILVLVDEGRRAARRVGIALELAKRHGARLTGLYVADMPSGTVGFDGVYAPDPYSTIQRELEGNAARAHALFDEQVRQVEGVATEWRQSIGSAVTTVCINARYHDLVVMGQHDREYPVPGVPYDLPEAVVLGGGRPVLVLPYAGDFGVPSRHALIGWNAGREATRAVTDALPMLAQMKATTVMTINAEISERAHGESTGADIALYLARHGVNVEVKREPGLGRDVGATLLSGAADMDVDLIVMGLYGHSRLLEFVLGGASRTILQTMTVPVLLSH